MVYVDRVRAERSCSRRDGEDPDRARDVLRILVDELGREFSEGAAELWVVGAPVGELLREPRLQADEELLHLGGARWAEGELARLLGQVTVRGGRAESGFKHLGRQVVERGHLRDGRRAAEPRARVDLTDRPTVRGTESRPRLLPHPPQLGAALVAHKS